MSIIVLCSESIETAGEHLSCGSPIVLKGNRLDIPEFLKLASEYGNVLYDVVNRSYVKTIKPPSVQNNLPSPEEEWHTDNANWPFINSLTLLHCRSNDGNKCIIGTEILPIHLLFRALKRSDQARVIRLRLPFLVSNAFRTRLSFRPLFSHTGDSVEGCYSRRAIEQGLRYVSHAERAMALSIIQEVENAVKKLEPTRVFLTEGQTLVLPNTKVLHRRKVVERAASNRILYRAKVTPRTFASVHLP